MLIPQPEEQSREAGKVSCSEAALSFDLISDCVLQSTIIVNLDDPQASDIMLQNEAEFGKDSARGCSRSRQGIHI